jgi:hypothetical protein
VEAVAVVPEVLVVLELVAVLETVAMEALDQHPILQDRL